MTAEPAATRPGTAQRAGRLVAPLAAGAGIDDATFVQVMGAFAAGVAVVTTLDENGDPRGLTTTAVTSVSREPPLLLVCVDRSSRTLPALRRSEGFVINFLDAAHAALAVHFSTKAEDKFASLTWRAAASGAPVLHEHSHAWADCRIDQQIDAGDHVVLIAEIIHGGTTDDPERVPLAYFRRSFGRFAAGNA